MRTKATLRIDIWRLCRRYAYRSTSTTIVEAARRVLSADPTPSTVHQWSADLQLLIEAAMPPVAWNLSPRTFLTEQAAALRIQRLLDAEGLVEQLEGERVA